MQKPELSNPPPPTDETLLDAVRNGSEAALRVLIERHQDRVFNVAAGFMPNRQDAEDLSQEVFIEVWRSAGQFRREARVSTWIYRIAVAKSLEALRYRARAKRAGFFRRLAGLDEPEALRQPSPVDLPDAGLEHRERLEILHRNLGKLPDKQRAALVLQKMEGLSQTEIAATLGVSVGAVEGLLSRGRESLRKHLENHYRNQSL